MLVNAIAAIYVRNNFYQQGQRKLLKILLVSLVTNFLLGYTLLHLYLYPPAPQYFPVGLSGRIVPIIPLNRPNQPDDSILQWASQAAVASFSYSYVNYREELQASSGFFSGVGWKNFMQALQQSNNLEAVKTKRMVVSAQLVGTSKIIIKELVNDLYEWRIDVPVLVTYQNDTEYTQQYNMVNILLSRVSMLNAPKGVGIEQLVVSPITTGTE